MELDLRKAKARSEQKQKLVEKAPVPPEVLEWEKSPVSAHVEGQSHTLPEETLMFPRDVNKNVANLGMHKCHGRVNVSRFVRC